VHLYDIITAENVRAGIPVKEFFENFIFCIFLNNFSKFLSIAPKRSEADKRNLMFFIYFDKIMNAKSADGR
jgi:hypothetical protein